MYGHTYSKSMDQPGKVANPAHTWSAEQEKIIFPCPRSCLRIWSRETVSIVQSRVNLFILHTQAESGAYLLRDSSRIPRRRPFSYFKPPYAIGSVPSLSGHAVAYRWRSLPRVRRHRTSKPQGSSERVLPWQVTMDQLIYASLSHTHYWYEVGMLKVPAMGVTDTFGPELLVEMARAKLKRPLHRQEEAVLASTAVLPHRKNKIKTPKNSRNTRTAGDIVSVGIILYWEGTSHRVLLSSRTTAVSVYGQMYNIALLHPYSSEQ